MTDPRALDLRRKALGAYATHLTTFDPDEHERYKNCKDESARRGFVAKYGVDPKKGASTTTDVTEKVNEALDHGEEGWFTVVKNQDFSTRRLVL